MTLDELRAHLAPEGFQPFEIKLSNGDVHHVRHPENVAIGRSIVVIAYPDQDRTYWCTPHHIVSVQKTTPVEAE